MTPDKSLPLFKLQLSRARDRGQNGKAGSLGQSTGSGAGVGHDLESVAPLFCDLFQLVYLQF